MKADESIVLHDLLALMDIEWILDGEVHVFKSKSRHVMQRIQKLMQDYEFRLTDVTIILDKNISRLRYSKQMPDGRLSELTFWYWPACQHESVRRAIFYCDNQGTYVRFGGSHAVTFGLSTVEKDRLVAMFRREHPDIPYVWGPVFSR